MTIRTITVREAAESLGVKPGWVRIRIADGVIQPVRAEGKGKKRYLLDADDLEVLRSWAQARTTRSSKSGRSVSAASAADAHALARVVQLEEERSNLLVQVAWARALAQEQQKAIEHERERVQRLEAELRVQQSRIEALKALTVWDRLLGRHKGI